MALTTVTNRLTSGSALVGRLPPWRLHGKLSGLSGLAVEVTGIARLLSVGDRLRLLRADGAGVEAEVVGFQGSYARAMAFAAIDGLGPESLVLGQPHRPSGVNRNNVHGIANLAVSDGWLGRVIDPLGRPLDGRGFLPPGPVQRPVRALPPPAIRRARLGGRLETGVRALDIFCSCRTGQRLGLFAGSGVGKSTLLAMLARQTACDVVVLALVGERGREVRDFIEDDLGPTGLERSVVVVATSDSPPLMRREAAHAAMTVAEHFRDRGASVLLLMDSITRFCFALREIGLSAGEPPATRGYPPSLFAELPILLERAGPGIEGLGKPPGMITGLFTVLVEGDDHNEPVADAVRGILDGHVILERKIGEAGRYPAIDVLRSLSRTAQSSLTDEEYALTRRARAVLAVYAEMADLVRLGAYRAGSDAAVDEAVALAPRIEAVLQQDRGDRTTLPDSFARLRRAMDLASGQ